LKDIGKLDEVSELDTRALTAALKKKEWDEKNLDRLWEFATSELNHRLSISQRKKP
jgi:hypothetical protein